MLKDFITQAVDDSLATGIQNYAFKVDKDLVDDNGIANPTTNFKRILA